MQSSAALQNAASTCLQPAGLLASVPDKAVADLEPHAEPDWTTYRAMVLVVDATLHTLLKRPDQLSTSHGPVQSLIGTAQCRTIWLTSRERLSPQCLMQQYYTCKAGTAWHSRYVGPALCHICCAALK